MKCMYLSWAPFNRRAESFSSKIDAENVYVHFFGYRNKKTALLKYPLMALKTLCILFKKRPDVIIGMSPPLFTIVFIYVYCALTRKKFVIDAHTGSLVSPPWTRFRKMHQFLCRKAVTTIVTNDHLKEMVEDWGGHAMILIPPIEYPGIPERTFEKKHNLLIVNSYAYDEPIEETLKAASQFPEIGFYVTGAIHVDNHELIQRYRHVAEFTDFLPFEDYLSLLKNVDGVICLTTRNHTLQSGGVEAVYMGKPFLTSDFPVLKTLFPKGTVYVNPNDASDIARGIKSLIQNRDLLSREMTEAQKSDRNKWEEGLKAFLNRLNHTFEKGMNP